MIDRINVHLTNDCNYNCDVCFENKGNCYLDKDKLVKFINDIKPYHVGFVGGEPMLHPQINEIISALNPMDICIVTNGEHLSKLAEMPSNISIGIDNDDQTEVDKFIDSIWSGDRFMIEITITPTDPNKIDALIKKYKDLGCRVNISTLAFWDKTPAVKDYITPEYIAKMIELAEKNEVSFFGEKEPEDIHAFYSEYIPYGKQYKCVAPLNVFADGHLEFCDLEYFPTGMTYDNYDKELLVKPKFEMREQCKFCNLLRVV